MKVRGVFPRNLAEKENDMRELTRNLAEFSPRKFAFENFCSRSVHLYKKCKSCLAGFTVCYLAF